LEVDGQDALFLTYKSKSPPVIVIPTAIFVAPTGTIAFKFRQVPPPQSGKATHVLLLADEYVAVVV
jgi:hypothetical protein